MNSRILSHSFTILLLNLLAVESTIYFINTYMNKMLEFSAKNQPCRMHYDRRTMQNVLSKFDRRYVQRVNDQLLNDLSNSCKDFNQVNKTGGFIFPGTKWCGPGTTATGYNDLGVHSNEDRCCRDHDHCPNQLEPGQCRHGICNISPFTRSHCDCDDNFRKCLRGVSSNTANIIGAIYFNLAQGACFRERRSCPQSLRNNLSYSWFCEEWKFVPHDYFISSPVEVINHPTYLNQITDGSHSNSQKTSRIDVDLKEIFGKEDEMSKIMKNS